MLRKSNTTQAIQKSHLANLSQKTQAVKDGFGKIINGHTLDNVTAIQIVYGK